MLFSVGMLRGQLFNPAVQNLFKNARNAQLANKVENEWHHELDYQLIHRLNNGSHRRPKKMPEWFPPSLNWDTTLADRSFEEKLLILKAHETFKGKRPRDSSGMFLKALTASPDPGAYNASQSG